MDSVLREADQMDTLRKCVNRNIPISASRSNEKVKGFLDSFYLVSIDIEQRRVEMILSRSSVLTILVSLFLCLLPACVKATALTYNVPANEKACFFIWNDKPGKKIGFYFAVMYNIVKPKSNKLRTYSRIGSTRWFI